MLIRSLVLRFLLFLGSGHGDGCAESGAAVPASAGAKADKTWEMISEMTPVLTPKTVAIKLTRTEQRELNLAMSQVRVVVLLMKRLCDVCITAQGHRRSFATAMVLL